MALQVKRTADTGAVVPAARGLAGGSRCNGTSGQQSRRLSPRPHSQGPFPLFQPGNFHSLLYPLPPPPHILFAIVCRIPPCARVSRVVHFFTFFDTLHNRYTNSPALQAKLATSGHAPAASPLPRSYTPLAQFPLPVFASAPYLEFHLQTLQPVVRETHSLDAPIIVLTTVTPYEQPRFSPHT